ncbi:enhancer of rudimentary [Ostertagia ostertagi]
MASITYDVSHLYAFIDKLSDLSCLILNTETCQYVPHNKDWIKEKIFVMLRTQAKNE